MIQIYGPVRSRAFRCLWLLEELNVEYEHISLNLLKGEQKSDEFLRLNPAGKVPVFVEEDLILTESGAICNYLADRYAPGQWIPESGTRERARYDQWMYFCLTELEQPLWTMGKHKFALPEKYRIQEMLSVAQYEFGQALGLLNQALEDREYIVGGRFTTADLFIAQTMDWAERFSVDLKYPRLQDFVTQARSRGAYQRVYRLASR